MTPAVSHRSHGAHLVLKHLYKLSDEQTEYQLLDRMSYQRFCLLEGSATIDDRNTIWHYQQRLGVDGVTALFQAVDSQLLQHGCMARRGQIIVASTEPTVAIDTPPNNVSVPLALLLDERLTPLERNAWMVFRARVGENGTSALPNYEQMRPFLACKANNQKAAYETAARTVCVLP